MIFVSPPKTQLNASAPPLLQPGHTQGKVAQARNIQPRGFHNRINPVTIDSPVVIVYLANSVFKVY